MGVLPGDWLIVQCIAAYIGGRGKAQSVDNFRRAQGRRLYHFAARYFGRQHQSETNPVDRAAIRVCREKKGFKSPHGNEAVHKHVPDMDASTGGKDTQPSP